MPTYRALDITARISTIPLHISSYEKRLKSSSNDPLLRVFDAGRFLLEDPIGPDGDEGSVVRFIGPEKDMIFLMVEAKDGDSPLNEQEPSTPRRADSITAPLIRSNLTGSSITESDLSSLPTSSTSMLDVLYHSPRNENTTSEDPPSKVMSMFPPTTTSPQPGPSSVQAQAYRQQMQPQHQALMLSVNLGSKAFLTPELRKSFIGKNSRADLKVEILVNGQLAGTALARDAGSIKPLEFHFGGTRVCQSPELPWVYAPSSFKDSASINANERWSGASRLLEEEVDLRGLNKDNLRSPSGEYLSALSRLPLPERLAKRHILGTVDIMVTLGLRERDGSGSHCVTSPFRVMSTKFRSMENTTALIRDECDTDSLSNKDNLTDQDSATNHDHSANSPDQRAAFVTTGLSVGIPVISRSDQPATETGLPNKARPSSQSGCPPERVGTSSVAVWASNTQTDTAHKSPRKLTGTSNSAATSNVQTGNDRTIFRKTPGAQTTYKNSSNDLSLTTARKLTDSRRKTLEFAASIGIQNVPNMIVGSYINNRGQVKQGKRTLMTRLSDIMRMSEGENKQRAIKEVQEQAQHATPLAAKYTTTSSPSLPPNKKQKTSAAPGILNWDATGEAESQPLVSTPGSTKKKIPETGSTSKTSEPPSLYKGSALSYMGSEVERRVSREVGENFDEYSFLVGMRIVVV